MDNEDELELVRAEVVELQAILEAIRVLCDASTGELSTRVGLLITTVDNSALLAHDAQLREAWAREHA